MRPQQSSRPRKSASAQRGAHPKEDTCPSQLSLTVNGKAVTADVDPRTLLVDFLRNHLGLTGTHVGCDTGQCGACTVHLDGRAVKACNDARRAGQWRRGR